MSKKYIKSNLEEGKIDFSFNGSKLEKCYLCEQK